MVSVCRVETRKPSRMQWDDAGNSGRTFALLAAVLAVVMFVFPLMIPFPLLDPDEGLHASIAQEMVERGDWITPRFLGRPFLDKPIFYFWLQAASLWLFGPSEAAVRLPGLMFGLLGAVTTGLLGWRMFGRATGLIAGILYATTILPTALAQAASHDVALIPWINLALLLLWESDGAVARPAVVVQVVGAGMFLGLAILTKGLFGVAVVGLAYGSYLLITGRIRFAILARGMAALVIAALVASPWYALVEIQNPGYLRYFFLERHLLGFATASQPHGDGPWWYYLPILLGGGLPWIGYLPIVAQDGLARRGGLSSPAWPRTAVGAAESRVGPAQRSPTLWSGETHGGTALRLSHPTTSSNAMRLLWSWLIGWTLLMMLAGSKLATYVWPVFPAIAVLATTAWTRLIDGTLSAAARRSFARTFVWSSWSGPIVLPATVLALQAMFTLRFAWPVWVAVGVVAAAAPLPLIPWRAGRWPASLAAAALSLAVQFVVVMTLVLPPMAETFSARELARHFNRLGRLPPRLLVAEERIGSLVFYLDPPLRARLKADQLQQAPVDGSLRLRPGDVLAVPKRKLKRVRAYLDLNDDSYESVGHYRLYCLH